MVVPWCDDLLSKEAPPVGADGRKFLKISPSINCLKHVFFKVLKAEFSGISKTSFCFEKCGWAKARAGPPLLRATIQAIQIESEWSDIKRGVNGGATMVCTDGKFFAFI